MSEPGLYTHLYSQLRDCAELIDHVIVDLETNGPSAGKKERHALATLLRTVQKEPATNLSATLLATVIRENRTGETEDWGKVADAIDRGESSTEVIGPLGELARALESERAEMHARIQSSYAR